MVSAKTRSPVGGGFPVPRKAKRLPYVKRTEQPFCPLFCNKTQGAIGSLVRLLSDNVASIDGIMRSIGECNYNNKVVALFRFVWQVYDTTPIRKNHFILQTSVFSLSL